MKLTAKHMKWFHLGMMLLWLGLTVPTLVFWSDSILWVSVMSIYSIIVGHMAGYQGARSERVQEKRDE